MQTAVGEMAESARVAEIAFINRGRTDNLAGNKRPPDFPTAKSRMAAMGFVKDAGLCGTCHFFEWLEVGRKNRCKAGDFASASQHGCQIYQRE